MGVAAGTYTSPRRKRGSAYCGRGVWVSIPLGTPQHPLDVEEVAECRRLLDEEHAKAARASTVPAKAAL
jgi:hypothetical protein